MGLLVDETGRVLLGLRAPSKAVLPARWDAIGGRVEDGETDEAALARELEEELGVRPSRLVLIASGPRETGGQSYHLSVFAVPEWLGGNPANRSEEHVALNWFSETALARLPHLASHDHLAWARAARDERRRPAETAIEAHRERDR